MEIRVGQGFGGPCCHKTLRTCTSLLPLSLWGGGASERGMCWASRPRKRDSPWLDFVNFKGQPIRICGDTGPRSFWKPDDLNSSLARSSGQEVQAGSRRPQLPPPFAPPFGWLGSASFHT